MLSKWLNLSTTYLALGKYRLNNEPLFRIVAIAIGPPLGLTQGEAVLALTHLDS